jgi:hypothetical protein
VSEQTVGNLFNFSTETFLLLEISAVTEVQTEFSNPVICLYLHRSFCFLEGSTALCIFRDE